MGNQKLIQNVIQKAKNMKKDQWLIVILAGVLLFIIVLPTGGTKKEAAGEKSEAKAEQTATGTETATGETAEAYETYLEQRLETLLGRIEGVGKVQVMVTLADNGEQILEKDEKESRTETEEGSGDNARTATEVDLEYATIFVEEDGNKTPYIVQIKNPKVEGVVVVCQGGGSSQVAQNISRAIGALFTIETHKIMVMKME